MNGRKMWKSKQNPTQPQNKIQSTLWNIDFNCKIVNLQKAKWEKAFGNIGAEFHFHCFTVSHFAYCNVQKCCSHFIAYREPFPFSILTSMTFLQFRHFYWVYNALLYSENWVVAQTWIDFSVEKTLRNICLAGLLRCFAASCIY